LRPDSNAEIVVMADNAKQRMFVVRAPRTAAFGCIRRMVPRYGSANTRIIVQDFARVAQR
jgi:hypothetical protein